MKDEIKILEKKINGNQRLLEKLNKENLQIEAELLKIKSQENKEAK